MPRRAPAGTVIQVKLWEGADGTNTRRRARCPHSRCVTVLLNFPKERSLRLDGWRESDPSLHLYPTSVDPVHRYTVTRSLARDMPVSTIRQTILYTDVSTSRVLHVLHLRRGPRGAHRHALHGAGAGAGARAAAPPSSR